MSQAGLFSAVTSAFIVEVNSQFQPDPNEETAALLRVLIYKVDNTTFGDTIPVIPQPWTGPPRMIVQVQAILFASLAASLFSAFLAMLGKQWLNRYASIDMRGSAIERNQDRQRKFDGIINWYFDHVMESLPLMLQAALLLLGCALSRYLWEIDTTAASVVLSVTLFGVLFYLFIVIAGAAFVSCPYQTPGAHILRHILDIFRRIPDILRRVPRIPGVLHSAFSSLLEESFSCGAVINVCDGLKSDRQPPDDIANFLLWTLSLPIWLALDVCKAVVWLLVISSRWVHLQLQQESERQAAVLEQHCISWTLRISLDGPVRMSALSYLVMTRFTNLDPTLVVDCFDVLFGCLKIINNKKVIAQGTEQLVGMSALCCLHVLPHITTDSTLRTLEDIRQRYTRVFPSMIVFDLPARHTLGAIHNILHSKLQTPRWNRWVVENRVQWTDYKPSSNEHIIVADALAKISQFEYQKRGREKVPRWLLRFALHSLAQYPLPPISVVFNCLSIIATDLGYDLSKRAISGDRCVRIWWIFNSLTRN